jgi:hypothetical protein
MGRMYYYHSRRVGNTVRRVYGGSGIRAVLAAQMDADEREDRRAAELAQRAKVAALRAETAELAGWLASADAVVAAAMRAFGFRRVNRQWRRKQESTEMSNTTLATIETTDGLSWRSDELWKQAGAVDQAALKKARKGDKNALKTVSAFLAHPAAQALYGDAGRHALERWVTLYAGGDPVLKRGLINFAADLRVRLAGATPNALDLLLAEKIVIGWLFSAWAEDQLARALTRDLTIAEHEVFMKRVEMANRVLMASCRTLAKIRRAKLPDVLALVNVNAPGDQKPAVQKLVVPS